MLVIYPHEDVTHFTYNIAYMLVTLLETGYDDNDNNVKQSENKDTGFDDKNLQIHTVYYINNKGNIFGSVHRQSTAWPEVRKKVLV